MVLFKLVPRTFEEYTLFLVLYFIILLFCFCFLFLLFQTRVLCICKRQPFLIFLCQFFMPTCLCPRFLYFKISIDVTLLAPPQLYITVSHVGFSMFGLFIRGFCFCVFGIYITIFFSLQTFYFQKLRYKKIRAIVFLQIGLVVTRDSFGLLLGRLYDYL